MEFLDENILKYVEAHTSAEDGLLRRINRETHLSVLKPRMLSGHLQGRVLAMVSKMIKPRLVLEIGTYTGYSALCLAEGLAENGKLVTIDINEELEGRVRGYFKESKFNDKIDYRIGDAKKVIPTLDGPIDLVFIDADKEGYSLYYDLAIDKVKTGGFILADNVLWSGKVLDEKPDKDTMEIVGFNRKVAEDPRVEHLLLPIRDGIMVLRKAQ
ncbi:MAG TPA: O-methyltransferase [Cyclobacteriaceae bacterium]|nr:O-methyltransferase [Cyclobacteriaceae bacterium]MCB9239395.1 O-methyltransferase [Flammeovirgaceae bacterium]MCB0499680.1 O-methyltransferase [Cyclobacteriaceae bacterium]MCO5271222.1 O-methyltransferase [Cyclobacteriaceae bacterium]MCW5902572.1 O-methyltransferase [Cyclobacteriaceae bacterium]